MWRQQGGLMALSSAPHAQCPASPTGGPTQHKAEVTASSINPHAEHHTWVLQMGPATSSLSAIPEGCYSHQGQGAGEVSGRISAYSVGKLQSRMQMPLSTHFCDPQALPSSRYPHAAASHALLGGGGEMPAEQQSGNAAVLCSHC